MWFLLGLLSLIVIEIVLLIKLGGAIGIWLTLGWIIFAIWFGIILLRGVAMLGAGAMGYRIDVFNDPQNPLAHRGLVMIAGLLFIVPGLLTDVFGFLLLFPPVRRLLISMIASRFNLQPASEASSTVIDAEWTDVSASAQPRNPDSSDQRP